MNNLNTFRYGDLVTVQRFMDGDNLLSDYELRAIVMNLVDTVRRIESKVNTLYREPL